MKGFIEVTKIVEPEFYEESFEGHEVKVSICVNRIIQIEPYCDGCFVVVFYTMQSECHSFQVKESYEEIKELIKQAL